MDLSSIYSRPSILNSPGCPSVSLPSPGPSVRTLNESDDGKYYDDILSLANFSCGDLESSDGGSLFNANISSNSRLRTPSSSSHDQHQPPLPENPGETGQRQPSIRPYGKPTDQSVSPHIKISSRQYTIASTSDDSSHPDVSLIIENFNNDPNRQSVVTDKIPVSHRPGIPNDDAGSISEYSSEGHRAGVVSPDGTVE